MQTTNYICDLCKTSKSREDLSKIKVETEGIRCNHDRYNPLKIDICKECLEKKGFIVNPKPEQTEEEIKKKNILTLESKFLEILEDLGVQFYE